MRSFVVAACLLGTAAAAGAADAATICEDFGPQTPRDISSAAGSNPKTFPEAPPATALNLCNIHFHAPAEHKGPGFSASVGSDDDQGFACNGTGQLSAAELAPLTDAHGGCHGVKPGDTIEVHWVYSSCDVGPGKGLAPCVPDSCAHPQLRVETQVFLVVNDPAALDFGAFAERAQKIDGLVQAKALPTGTGTPVGFPGSTTGPAYTQAICSPFHVTWSVRPACAKVDLASLNAWCDRNAFGEDHAHGVRALVNAPGLLAPIR